MESSTTHLVLAPDDVIDLQVHTIYSDGTWIPEQLIDYLTNNRFGLVAITDHDRVDTVSALQRLAKEKQLPVLIAAEMTTVWKGEMTDILCYGFNPKRDDLNELAQDITRRQRENTRMVYENLIRKGYTFSHQHEGAHVQGKEPDELLAILGKPSAQQLHELVTLLKRHGYGTGEISAGEIIMDLGGIFAANDIAVVVEAAHRIGAVCLIAHPGRRDGFVCYDVDLLDQLRQEVPIDGFEVYYPAHTSEQIAMYLHYAEKHRLLTSSGSDSHGPEKKPIKYPAKLSQNLLERVGIRVK